MSDDKMLPSPRFRFRPEALDKLRALQIRCGAANLEDLNNIALVILDWAICMIEEGKEIASIDRSDESFAVLDMEVFRKIREMQKGS